MCNINNYFFFLELKHLAKENCSLTAGLAAPQRSFFTEETSSDDNADFNSSCYDEATTFFNSTILYQQPQKIEFI